MLKDFFEITIPDGRKYTQWGFKSLIVAQETSVSTTCNQESSFLFTDNLSQDIATEPWQIQNNKGATFKTTQNYMETRLQY
jgi:hypothetical protein